MSYVTSIPFTPLTTRMATENPELLPGLEKLKLLIGEHDFEKYIDSLLNLKKSGDLLLLITGKTMHYSIIEGKFIPMLKESFGIGTVRVISQG